MKSHLNDKPTCCLPLRPQSRHSDLWYFGAQLLSLQPCCLRLAHYITVTHSRLASNAVVSSLFDRISTCRIAHPSLDARTGTNVVWNRPHGLLNQHLMHRYILAFWYLYYFKSVISQYLFICFTQRCTRWIGNS